MEEEKPIEIIKKIEKVENNGIIFNITNNIKKTTQKIKKNLDVEVGALSYIYFSLFVIEILTTIQMHKTVKIILYFFTAILLTIAKRNFKKGDISKWFVNTMNGSKDLWNMEDIFNDDSKK